MFQSASKRGRDRQTDRQTETDRQTDRNLQTDYTGNKYNSEFVGLK